MEFGVLSLLLHFAVVFGQHSLGSQENTGIEKVSDVTVQSGQTLPEELLSHTLSTVLTAKMNEARNVILHGHPKSDIRPLDPYRMDPLTLTVQEPNGFVNVSLNKISVTGLGEFHVGSIATNWHVMRTSVLMKFPELKIHASYKLKGYLNPPFSQSLSDEGLFEATVDDASATWVGKVEPPNDLGGHSSDSFLSISQAAIRTYWESVSHTFKSFLKKNEDAMAHARDLLRAVKTAIMEKLQRIVEDGLEEAMAHVMGRSKGSWFEMFPPVPQTKLFDAEDDEGGSPIRYQDPHPHSRKKRQVPCENGETLDEYVDTLLRFGRRLLRFQEPLPFPNTTVKIDDMFTVFMYNGGVRGASNINRKKSAYVKCTNTSTTLRVSVEVKGPKVTSKYRVFEGYDLLLFNGEMDAMISEVEVMAQLTQTMLSENDFMTTLDMIKIVRLGKITIRLRGLGNITSAAAMLANYYVNQDKRALIPIAEASALVAARQMLTNITIPVFSII